MSKSDRLAVMQLHLPAANKNMQPRVMILTFLLLPFYGAGAAEVDALAISKNIQNRHFPHYTLLDPI